MRGRLLLIAGAATLVAGAAHTAPVCTILADAASGKPFLRDGAQCGLPNSPASTFKLPLALMGFDARILTEVDAPLWPYRADYNAPARARKDADPKIWIHDSLLWFSRKLTRELGEIRFRRYVDGFAYGNRDVLGARGKNDGLTQSWLSAGSLMISPDGQIAFLHRLWNRQLPLSGDAYDKTLAVTPAFPTAGGWTIYGKTGTGFQKGADGAIDRDRQFGWFVGWALKGERAVLFARLIRDEAKASGPAGLRARDAFVGEFPDLIAKGGE